MSRSTKDQHRQQHAARRKKCVFEFFDGARERKVDVWKILLQLQSRIPIELAQGSAVGGDGIAKLVDTVRELMAVPAWTEESDAGLTDGELLEVFQRLMAVVEVEKKVTKQEAI